MAMSRTRRGGGEGEGRSCALKPNEVRRIPSTLHTYSDVNTGEICTVVRCQLSPTILSDSRVGMG